MMTQTELGRLEKVDIRKAWAGEATDFTPWLAQPENLALLGETLGIDLEPESTEQQIGAFYADIVCTHGATGKRVVIENQLESTDHGHLGQLVTYAAGLEDVDALIWVTTRFREEHRAALDWLNGRTDAETMFFGVEVEVWRIGESLPAPRFNIVSKPNGWVKAEHARASSSLSTTQEQQLRYWTAFSEFLAERRAAIRPSSPLPQNWISAGTGKSGCALIASITSWDFQTHANGHERLRVDLLLEGQRSKERYATLLAVRPQLEAALGHPLGWYNPAEYVNCRIYTEHQTRLSNEDEWPAQFEWLLDRLSAFDNLFRPIVQRIDDPGFTMGTPA